jgi:hypothetical protein
MDFPFPRQQFVDAIHRVIGDPSEDVGWPNLRVNGVELRCVNERVHEGGPLPPEVRQRALEKPASLLAQAPVI